MKKTWLSKLGATGAVGTMLALSATMAPLAHAADAPGVAFVYLGNPGDAGWTFAHDAGTKEVEAKYGNKIKITRVENVPESADSERVFRDLAAKGNKVIVGTSFGYQDFELKVARDFPDITFLTATGYKKAKNFGVYDNRMYQGAYLAGVAAGYVTKTNTLGFVASVPIPEVIRNINAYTMGARSVNPKVHTKVIWINSWFDPGKEKQAAETVWLGMPDKAVDLEDVNTTVVPAKAMEAVAAKRAELQSGKWDVFMGPVKDQSGAVKIPAGTNLTDPELQRINWYVEGVDGALPK